MEEIILDVILKVKKIFANKYGGSKNAQASTSFYATMCKVQKAGKDAKFKRIASLQEYIENNKEYL